MLWHIRRWLQRSSEQRALLDRRMCPTGLWMQSCNDLLSGSKFGYIRKICPWRKKPHVWHTHRWRVLGSCLWDMPNSDCGSLCKCGWYPIFYSQEQDLKWCTQWGKWSWPCVASKFQLWPRQLSRDGWTIAFGTWGPHQAICRCGVPQWMDPTQEF